MLTDGVDGIEVSHGDGIAQAVAGRPELVSYLLISRSFSPEL
jgi:hypothetical protein